MRNRLRFWLACNFTRCCLCERYIFAPYWQWLGAVQILDGCAVHERCYADEVWAGIR